MHSGRAIICSTGRAARAGSGNGVEKSISSSSQLIFGDHTEGSASPSPAENTVADGLVRCVDGDAVVSRSSASSTRVVDFSTSKED